MVVFRPDIPPHITEIIRHLPPDLKRSVKQALRALSLEPFSGEALLRELEGLRKYRVRRFRIIYAVDRKRKIIRIFAVGHRRTIYEEVAEQLRRRPSPRG
ncbi:MAG: type II toxin-antitoxin system RelE/ParE family toxin [Deltaproteobacteria bacterium]|nr:type II toxin-antitoxin system RelE/ParE family toxin [Deltaproteobacteria bacterium]